MEPIQSCCTTYLKNAKQKNIGVREARTLDLRITRISYETYALANCATTPLVPILQNQFILFFYKHFYLVAAPTVELHVHFQWRAPNFLSHQHSFSRTPSPLSVKPLCVNLTEKMSETYTFLLGHFISLLIHLFSDTSQTLLSNALTFLDKRPKLFQSRIDNTSNPNLQKPIGVRPITPIIVFSFSFWHKLPSTI